MKHILIFWIVFCISVWHVLVKKETLELVSAIPILQFLLKEINWMSDHPQKD